MATPAAFGNQEHLPEAPNGMGGTMEEPGANRGGSAVPAKGGLLRPIAAPLPQQNTKRLIGVPIPTMKAEGPS